MIKRIQFTALLIAAGALLAIPAVGQADHKTGHSNHGHGHGQGTGKSCAKPTVNKGFTVRGTLDGPVTQNGDETSVAITVTGANRHARVSGELKLGVQVAYTVDSSRVRRSGYETGELPAAGDKVRIVGKIAVRKKCAAPGASLVNVRTVKIIDAD